MKWELNRASEIPLTKQIYQAIADKILSNLIAAGTLLPSVRNLSKELKVSTDTVIQAYRDLEKDNFITRIQGKGTFVNQREQKPLPKSPNTLPYAWQLSVQDYLPRAHFSNHAQSHEENNLSISRIDPGLFPNRFIEKLITDELLQNSKSISTYGEIQGDKELREVYARYLKKEHKLKTSPQDLLITCGSQQGIELVAKSFVGPGDFIMVEAPTYPAAIDIFRSRGASIIQVPVDQQGLRVDLLDPLVDKYKPRLIYTIPNFQNPTGAVLSFPRRQELLHIAQRTNTLIVEDDPWSEIYFDGCPPLPLKSLDTYGHVIYLKGSKIIGPGCRIGVLAANGTLLSRLIAAKGLSDLGTPLLNQKVVSLLLESKRISTHTEKLRTALEVRRDMVTEMLKKLPDVVTVNVPTGGLNYWITLPACVNTDNLLYEAKKEGVSFMPGSAFYAQAPECHHLRICFSSVDDYSLQDGVHKLFKIINRAVKGRKE